MSFSSAYTYKLYEYLRSNCYNDKFHKRQNNNEYEIIVNISELKFLMGVLNASNNKVVKLLEFSPEPDYEEAEALIKEDTKYSDWDSFRVCLRRAVNEINGCECCDIHVDYKKNGHSNEVKFNVSLKEDKNKKVDVAETLKTAVLSQLAEIMSSYDITPSELQAVAETSGYDIEKIKKAYAVMCESDNVKYPVKYMIAAIKSNYEPSCINKKHKNTDSGSNSISKNRGYERNYSKEFFESLEV